MEARINLSTLEIENIKLPAKALKWQTDLADKAKYAILLTQSILCLSNFLFALIIVTDNYAKKLAYTIIADFSSLAIMLLFYIILPKFGLQFAGINTIPSVVYVALEFEFNAALYPYINIVN